MAVQVLSDVLKKGLNVVFCGTAAGKRSALLGTPYASPTNRFWMTLRNVRLTPQMLCSPDYRNLLRHKIGLTDLCKVASGTDKEVKKQKFDVEEFRRKMALYRPRFIAFNGKRSARAFFGYAVPYGLQPNKFAESRIYVLPSTSGAARRWWDETYWRDLRDQIHHLPKE